MRLEQPLATRGQRAGDVNSSASVTFLARRHQRGREWGERKRESERESCLNQDSHLNREHAATLACCRLTTAKGLTLAF